MLVSTVSALRGNIKKAFEEVTDSSEPMLVANRRDPGRNVVIVPQSDWESISETLRIYENPEYHEALLRRVKEAKAGKTETHQLLDA